MTNTSRCIDYACIPVDHLQALGLDIVLLPSTLSSCNIDDPTTHRAPNGTHYNNAATTAQTNVFTDKPTIPAADVGRMIIGLGVAAGVAVVNGATPTGTSTAGISTPLPTHLRSEPHTALAHSAARQAGEPSCRFPPRGGGTATRSRCTTPRPGGERRVEASTSSCR